MFLPAEILYNIGQHLGVMEREVLKLPPRKLSSQRVQDLEEMLESAHTSGKVHCVMHRNHLLTIVLWLIYDNHSGLNSLSSLYELQRDVIGNVRVLAYDINCYLNVIWDSKALS